MTDERLVERLAALRNSVAADKTYAVHAVETLDVVIARLKPTPPPPDSIAVTIAVAIGGSATCYGFSEGDNDDAIDCAIEQLRGMIPTHLGIATLHIPRRHIPVVTGNAVAFDPEATDV